jgi:glyoxylase-like metal-dependent hydrolase (beta-lactamase superfamily II)
MHITLVDDSIAFDGYTPSSRPLGGAEKAFASLPGALVRRGHTVEVYNRCRWAMTVEDAHWNGWEARRPLATDLLIAFRKPSLLEFVRQAPRRLLWHTGPGRMLERRATRTLLADHKASVLLVSETQRRDCGKGVLGVLPPAARRDFLADIETRPRTPPTAVVTTHPAHGLDRLLDLWAERIRPAVPEAELLVYSTTLAKAADGEAPPPEELAAVAAKAQALAGQGVAVIRPPGDQQMADAFRQARVHLYPGHADDHTAFTLMESQACGLPAVVRPLGAAPERIADGRSGMVAPDDDAFANLAILLLSDESVYNAQSAEARALYRGRDWDAAAAALEAMIP